MLINNAYIIQFDIYFKQGYVIKFYKNQLQMIQYFSKSEEQGILKEIPNIKQAIRIIKISYPHNCIQKISNSITKAVNTQQIDLSYNKISSMEPVFELRKLRVINLSYNQIANVPKGVLRLKKLQVIDLSFNLLSNLGSINPLFELFKIRKTNLKIQLQGNKVMEEFGQKIIEKFNAIQTEAITTKEKINNSSLQVKQFESSKSLEVRNKQKSYQSQIKSYRKPQQPKIQFDKAPISSLEQARKKIQQSLNSLMEYERKFEVISATNFEGWNQNLVQQFKKEAGMVKDFIEVHKKIIGYLTTQFLNPSDATSKLQTSFIQTTQLKQLIKDQHSTFLQSLSESDVPMKFYKVWVQLYRQLRVIIEQIKWQAWSIIKCEIRNQQIQTLKLISPTKEEIFLKKKSQEQLDGLLFSNNKQEEEGNSKQCSQCFIKNEEIRQLKEIVDLLTEQNADLKQRVEGLVKENQRLSKNDEILGKQLIIRQENIIENLNSKIDASIYQKVLLAQAKGIEDLIKCDKQNLIKSTKNFENGRRKNQLFQTALSNQKSSLKPNQGISQFTPGLEKEQVTPNIIKCPYFKPKQDLIMSIPFKESRNKTKSSLASTEKKKRSQQEMKKSKNQTSITNLRDKTSLPSNIRQSQQFSSGKLIPTRLLSQQSEVYKQVQSQNVMTSDFVLTETGRDYENKGTKITRQALAEIIQVKSTQLRKNKNNSNIKSSGKKKESNYMSTNHMKQKGNLIEMEESEKYIPIQYRTVNLKDQQSYQNYMKYHLRNSIIETLVKKGKRCNINKDGKVKEDIIEGITKRDKVAESKEDLLIRYSSRMSSEREDQKQKSKGQLIKKASISKSYTYMNQLNKLRF